MSELSEIKERLTILETTTKERWDAHDARSKERWGGVKDVLERIEGFVENSPERRETCMKIMRTYVNLWVGIPVTIVSIIGVFIMIHKLFTH